MKKYQYIFAALLAIAACQKNEVAPETIDEEPVWGYITAVAEVPQTKALLEDADGDGNLDYAWTVGDKLTILVYKGNDDTPGYARREASISSVSDGVATIKYEKGTGKNEATKIAGAWYPVRNNNDNLPDQSVPVSQDFSKGQVAIPLVADNVSMVSPMDPGAGVNEGGKVYDSKTTLHFSVNPAIGTDGYSVLGFRLKKGGADRTIKSIKVNNGSQDYTLTNINTDLTDDVQYFYIVLPASDTPLSNFKATITANDGANDLVYNRTKSSYTPTAGKVTRFPVISDMDNIGRYTWIFKGEDGPSGNELSQNAPFTYWFRSQADRFTTITRGEDYWTQEAWVQSAEQFKYRFGFCPALHDNGQGKSSSTWGEIAESKTTINGTTNQVMRFPIHVGNYPIFAIKMSKLSTLGNNRTFKLDVNSIEAQNQTGNAFIGRDMPVKFFDSTTSKSTLSETETEGIYYFDLSNGSITFKYGDGSNRSALPNTRTLHFTTWQLQIPDVTFTETQDPLPTCKFYWAGFFNSVDELTTFASSH